MDQGLRRPVLEVGDVRDLQLNQSLLLRPQIYYARLVSAVRNRKLMVNTSSGILALCHYRSQLGVLGLLVSPQVNFPLECSSAQITCERLEPSVLPGVSDQVR